jgi:hypothetical protein
MSADPVTSNPDHYAVVFENDRVRVLEYHDEPGDGETVGHAHPDSVMVTLTGFSRRLRSGGQARDLDLPAAAARWLPAQEHTGENIGETPTRAIFIELKEPSPHGAAAEPSLGPDAR